MLRPGQAFKTRLRSKNRTFYARRDQMKAESRNRWRTFQGIIARSLISARSLGWSKPGPRMENVAASRRHGLADQRGAAKTARETGSEVFPWDSSRWNVKSSDGSVIRSRSDKEDEWEDSDEVVKPATTPQHQLTHQTSHMLPWSFEKHWASDSPIFRNAAKFC
jgi:hypothetical protein